MRVMKFPHRGRFAGRARACQTPREVWKSQESRATRRPNLSKLVIGPAREAIQTTLSESADARIVLFHGDRQEARKAVRGIMGVAKK